VRGVGVDCFLGNLVPASRHPLHLDGGGHGGSRLASRADDGVRGWPRARGQHPQETGHQHGGPPEEVPLVAQQQRQQGPFHAHRDGLHPGGAGEAGQGHQEHQAVTGQERDGDPVKGECAGSSGAVTGSS
jgi:hypothetical protein